MSGDWADAVRVEEVGGLTEELRRRVAAGSGERPLSVSDLVAPRRAFWRRSGVPAPIEEGRRERMDAGRAWHDRLAVALAGEGAFEVRLRRDGVSARIDLLADVPVEVKTGSRVDPTRLPDERPDHVEQLAMYCGLTGYRAGRIATLTPVEGRPPELTVVELPVDDPSGVAEKVQHRARALRMALRDGRPDGLPRCRWFDRGCEYQQAGTCTCQGNEPPFDSEILGGLGPPVERSEIAERWKARLREPPEPPLPPRVHRFRELIYPRRAFFDRTSPPVEEAPAPRPPQRAGPDLYERLTEALEGGVAGEVARLTSTGASVEEEVVGFRGIPYLTRTSRGWERLRPGELVRRSPQYALDLGFRAAATGSREGYVVLAYERAETDRDRFQVLRLRFEPVERWAALMSDRAAQLERALATGRPEDLPTCPEWMERDCPYRAVCGCAAGGRSQR